MLYDQIIIDNRSLQSFDMVQGRSKKKGDERTGILRVDHMEIHNGPDGEPLDEFLRWNYFFVDAANEDLPVLSPPQDGSTTIHTEQVSEIKTVFLLFVLFFGLLFVDFIVICVLGWCFDIV